MFDDAIRSPRRLILSLVVVAACAASAAPAAASASPIAPSLADSACGTGTAISVPPAWLAGGGPVVTEMLPGRITLVVASAGFPAASYAEAHAYTSDCAPDNAFGSHGAERLAFGGRDFSIAAAVPAPGGGTILAGGTAKGWLVARLGASGTLDRAFGSGGWTVLPWPGSVSAIAETRSGDIVLGGSEGTGCWVVDQFELDCAAA
ncbi:MAG: hypothetical protein ACRDPY_33995 [Streptosporangiaceae bacterium]